MEDPISTLLPYILETLSRKAELCDTFDHICKEIEEQLIAENNTRFGNVRNALQHAINVGQSIGIITLTNETIRMPFNFWANAPKITKNVTTADQQVQQLAIGTGNPVIQNATERNIVVKSKTPNRKVQKNFATRREDSDFKFGPAMRSKKFRRPPRARSCARKTIRGRSSRGKAGRGRKHARSAYRRRVSRKGVKI